MALLRTNTGIGTTNPTSALHVIGDVLVTGVVTATGFNGNINAGIATITNLSVTREVVGTSTVTDLINTRFTSGLGTITTLSGTNLTYTNSDFVNLNADYGYIATGIVTQLTGTYLDFSNPTGIASIFDVRGNTLSYTNGDFTFMNADFGYIVSGVVTDISGSRLNYTGIGTIATLHSGIATITDLNNTRFVSGIATITNLNTINLVSTNSDFINLNANNGYIDVGIVTDISGTRLNYTGVGTIATINSTNATITNISNTNLNNTGFATVGNFAVNNSFDVYPSGTFHGDLTILGNVSIAGTSAIVNAADLKIKDKDIILGVTTNTFNQDISTDTTANHGGIAIASTEGSPLVPLNIVGIDTLPNTYKQLMWIKSGTWSGLNTDAWMFNYGVGIGSTQIPNGVRLAVGQVQITDRQINAITAEFNRLTSGIATITGADISNLHTNNLYSQTGIITDLSGTRLNYTGVGTITTFNSTSATIANLTNTRLTSGIATVSSQLNLNNLYSTGISTFISGPVFIGSGTTTGTTDQKLQVTGGAYVSGAVGIGTTNPSQTLDVSGTVRLRGAIYDSFNTPGAVDYVITSGGPSGWSWQPVTSIGAGTLNGIVVKEEGVTIGTAGSITTLDFKGLNIVATGIPFGAIATITVSDTPTFNSLNVTGNSVLGVTSSTQLYVSGVTTVTGVTTFISDVYVGNNLYIQNDLVFDEFTARNINVTGLGTLGIASATTLNVTGVTTLASAGGITTTGGDLYVGDDLEVAGDINFNGFLYQNGEKFTSGIGIGSTSVNPQSGVISQRVGIGFTDLNIVGTGISVTGYGSTVVIDFNEISAGAAGRLSISTVFNPRIQDVTFVGGATTTRIGITTQTDRFVFDTQTGSVGIGTSGSSIPAYKLDVVGDINSSTSVKIKGVDVLEEATRLAIILG